MQTTTTLRTILRDSLRSPSRLAGAALALVMAPVLLLAAKPAPAPAAATTPSAASTAQLETATFAAGCFWGTEEFFRNTPGVVETQVGYTGGGDRPARYEEVASGETGHAESVELKFDPTKISYDQLLDLFFKMHDPTTANRQGNDRGTQYRSAVFTHGEAQQKAAEAFKAKVERSGAWKAAITTEIAPAGAFFRAESYHQKYLEKNPGGYDNHYLRELSFDQPAATAAAAPATQGDDDAAPAMMMMKRKK